MSGRVEERSQPRRDRDAFAEETRRLLDDLDTPDRTALELIYFAGLTQKEAAAALGWPLPALRARVAHGLRDLAARLLITTC